MAFRLHKGASDVVLVSDHSASEHPKGGQDIWRRDQALGRFKGEAHAVFENDWEEVGDGIRAVPRQQCTTLVCAGGLTHFVVVRPNSQAKPQIFASQAHRR